MIIERTKNATRNIAFGWLLKIYQIFIPFLMRTAMIYYLGVEYLGLNSLFASILQVLSLAELGVGNAMVYSMYKPIVKDDKKTICALMQLYRSYYRVIGIVIAILGVALIPILSHLVKSDIPQGINIYVLYILNLATTVLSYWLFAYKNCLLNAHQRTDVISKVTLLTNTIQYVLQFFVLCFLRDYYLFLIIALVTQVMTNIVTAIVTTKIYPQYHPYGTLEKDFVQDINNRIKDLFTSKIGSVIVNSADTIVISTFLGLTMLAIYQNYYYILNSIVGFVSIIFSACTAGIGNSIIVETKEKNYNDLKKFTFMIVWITGFCASCLLCLYQPFMRIWVGNKLLLSFQAVICFCIYFFIIEINALLNTYKDSAGIWHEDRFRPLATALTNLFLNIIMIHFWGIYGVLLSTILSTLFVGMPWLLHNLFTILFEKAFLKDYLKHLVYYTLIAVVGCMLSYFVCSIFVVPDFVAIFLRGVICCIVPNLFFLIIYRNHREFLQSMEIVNRITKGKLKGGRRL